MILRHDFQASNSESITLNRAPDDGEPEAIDPAHLPAVLEGLAQAKARQFSSDTEVEAAFRRFEA